MTSHNNKRDEPSIRAKKMTLRRELASTIRSLSADAMAEESAQLREALKESALLPPGGRALIFAADATEPDLLGLGEGWGGDWSIALPLVEGEQLGIYEVTSADDLEIGAYGLREPIPARCRKVVGAEIDLVLLPGRGFTREGARLGRGGGFYDRLLATLSPRVVLVGCCFSCQVVPEIPMEGHDKPVHWVCSQDGLVSSEK